MLRANFRGRLRTLALATLIALPTLQLVMGLPAGATEPDPSAYSFKYSNGLQFMRNDGMVKIKFGGRIQADFASIHPSSALEAAVMGGDGEGVEFRRARLYVSGDLYDRIIFKAQYDFVDGVTKLNDMYIGMKKLGFLGTVKVGHMKEPFSLEELTSSKYITFMERALPSVFDSARNFGIQANNHHLDKRLTWAAGIFAPTDDQGDFFSAGTNMNISGRVTGLPHYEESGRKLVHLGFSLSRRVRDADEQTYGVRPEVHLARAYLASEGIQSDGSTILAAEFAWVCGAYSIQGEYKHGWIEPVDEGTGLPTSSLNGAYVQASWFVTGEHRVYNAKNGTFGRVSPTAPFDPSKGDWGAVEIAARYSFLDLNDNTILGGEEQNFTAGVNWYLYSNLRLTLNYVYADVKNNGSTLRDDDMVPIRTGGASGSIHAIQARAQLEF